MNGSRLASGPVARSPIARSPISQAAPVEVVDGWEVSTRRSTAALQVADLTWLSKVFVKADANGAFTARHPVVFGSARRLSTDVLEIGSDPGGWLTIGPVGGGAELVERLTNEVGDAGEMVSVIDLTHGRALLRLSGEVSVGVLAKICAVDLADTVTPNLSTFRSSVAKLVTDVVRDDLVDGTRSYLLHCERSSGQHLFNCLVDAGAEFGIDIAGPSR
jgi:heterotetrameric sarcosine oxidase gamma subunit